MALNLTDKARELLLSGSLNLTSDELHFILLNASFTLDKDFEDVADVNTYELSGTGYTGGFGGSGRKTVASKTFAHSAGHVAYMDCTTPVWTAINAGTIHAIGVFKLGTADNDSLFIGAYTLGADVTTNGGDWTYEIAATGLIAME
jgi:hypothetical protein